MIRSETFVFLGDETWGWLWRSTQEIAWRLAQHNRVLYFDPGRDPQRPILAEAIRNLPRFFRIRTRPVGRQLTLVGSPPAIPLFLRYLPALALRLTAPVVVRLNAVLLVRHVRRVLHTLRVEAPVLWVSDPRQADVVGTLGEKLACYYNHDDVEDFDGNARIRDLLVGLDDRLCRRADMVLATSQAQLERRRPLNPASHLLRHGVDFELFRPAAAGELPPPGDLAGLRRPVIGFAGWLGPHVDAALLLRVAQAYPECSVALIGPEALVHDRHRRALLECPNVHLLGRKERAHLPAYLQAFDVALMPFRLAGHIPAAFPIKTFEYLAAGRACVATALPELSPYRAVIRLAESAADFVALVGVAMQDQAPAAVAARIEVAQQNTWVHRVETLSELLAARLASRARTQLPG